VTDEVEAKAKAGIKLFGRTGRESVSEQLVGICLTQVAQDVVVCSWAFFGVINQNLRPSGKPVTTFFLNRINNITLQLLSADAYSRHMASSEKKIAANRANAAKSTGPKTPRGKRNSSRNGIRHGVLAKAILIDGESRDNLLKLCQALDEEYKPETPTEIALVTSATAARWRLIRLWMMESAGMVYEQRRQTDAEESRDPTTCAMLAFRSLNENSRHAELMVRYESRLDRQYHRAIDRLQQIRAAKMVSATRSQQLPQNQAPVV
jgi:hypothetical protein